MNRFEESVWIPPADKTDPNAVGVHSPLPAVSHSSCGKAIIVGEHAVVYGAEAIAMPLPSMRVSIKARPKSAGSRTELLLDGKAVSEHLRGVVDDAMRLLEIDHMPIEVEGNSGVLIGAGLGSSASICVVMLKALADISNTPLSIGRLAQLGNELEKRFHGNPSGLDTAVVAYEHVISFRRDQGAQPVDLGALNSQNSKCSPWPFVLIDSGLRSSTVSMIRVAKPYFSGSPGEKRVSLFDDVATRVAHGLATSDLDEVGQGMNEAHHMLREAGVVGDLLDDIYDLCHSIGVKGAKVTGAGGGGCVLALLDPQRSNEQLATLTEQFRARRVFPVRLNG